MKNVKLNLVLFLAVVFGMAASYGVYQYLNGLKAAYLEEGDFVQVAVATRNIQPKTPITPQLFSMQEIPSKYVNNDAAVAPEEINGRLTKTAIYQGEQILKGKVVDGNNPPEELAFAIAKGERALTVAVNEISGVAGLIRPGDFVDLLVTFDGPQGEALTSLILQNIKVLATDRMMTTEAGQAKPDKIYQTVTLSVTPQQALSLTLATEQGSVRLMLRSPSDTGMVNLPSSKINDLVR